MNKLAIVALLVGMMMGICVPLSVGDETTLSLAPFGKGGLGGFHGSVERFKRRLQPKYLTN